LRHNYALLKNKAQGAQIMAVVKSNAYGHGLAPVSQALYQAGCRSFAVTDAEEGCLLRPHLPDDAEIVLFSGVFDEADAKLCQQHQLTPVLTEPYQLTYLIKQSFHGKVWIKVDTGMHRLGVESAQTLSHAIQAQPNIQLIGIMSHLACADSPEHPLNQQQILSFQTIQSQYQAPAYSLFNSAGLIALSDKLNTQVMRPGIALYGMEPIESQVIGLKPVAQLSSRIMQIRDIKQGESVSYAASWVALHDMRIAVVAMGYADGLPRLLSNQGNVLCQNVVLPIVGKVCMDYCLLGIDHANVHVGDEVLFFDDKSNLPKANQVAQQCQTISYELFTGLGARLNRVYIGEES
jgi:alanine racemase